MRLNPVFVFRNSVEIVLCIPPLIDSEGIHPSYVGALPVQCAAMNMTNINPQLITIEAFIP